ncbi:hypothetical protein WQ57_13085 [Mesobacillus campisalis]|uniref:Uncharacterized protein n=1 Tax=Mesobacillus campisalis TaxID=1408103 RepID=A0A0M2SYG8_9BACI|nr:hypothetical protein [Mesobacillus campisalis]KKK37660.1 hypothetical protein WQ57_13085 [Mesobacillus campisalis]
MFRFSFKGSEWIIRFSPELQAEDEDKEAIIKSLITLGPSLAGYSHGESLLMFDEKMGATIIRTEKIPSFILTVSSIIPSNQWFSRKANGVEPYKE